MITARTCPHCGKHITPANWHIHGLDLRQWPQKPPVNLYLCRDCARLTPFQVISRTQFPDLPLLAALTP